MRWLSGEERAIPGSLYDIGVGEGERTRWPANTTRDSVAWNIEPMTVGCVA